MLCFAAMPRRHMSSPIHTPRSLPTPPTVAPQGLVRGGRGEPEQLPDSGGGLARATGVAGGGTGARVRPLHLCLPGFADWVVLADGVGWGGGRWVGVGG